MSAPPPTGGSSTPPTSPPWYANPVFHLVTGIAALAAGGFFYLEGAQGFGEGLATSGLVFLGVGSGVGAAASVKSA